MIDKGKVIQSQFKRICELEYELDVTKQLCAGATEEIIRLRKQLEIAQGILRMTSAVRSGADIVGCVGRR